VARDIQGWDYPPNDPISLIENSSSQYTKLEAIQRLADISTMYPMLGKYSIFLMDEAQAISGAAQTALLKPLETPSRAVWIFCTSEPEKFAKPLRDRCNARFTLKPMGKKERRELVARAAEWLNYKKDLTKFLSGLDEAEITSAREVLGAFEQFCNGVPLRIAVGLD
jgi:DNA polymerase III subunit gamma/tau